MSVPSCPQGAQACSARSLCSCVAAFRTETAFAIGGKILCLIIYWSSNPLWVFHMWLLRSLLTFISIIFLLLRARCSCGVTSSHFFGTSGCIFYFYLFHPSTSIDASERILEPVLPKLRNLSQQCDLTRSSLKLQITENSRSVWITRCHCSVTWLISQQLPQDDDNRLRPSEWESSSLAKRCWQAF